MRISKVFLTIIFLITIIKLSFTQDVPNVIQYQGNITDENGNFIDGKVNLKFAIYNNLASGSPVWSEEHNDIQVKKGLFSVYLGSINKFDLNFFIASEKYIEISVNQKVLTPRQRIANVAKALVAQTIPPGSLQPRYVSEWTKDNNFSPHQTTFQHDLNIDVYRTPFIFNLYFSPTNPPSEIHPVAWRWDNNAGNPVDIAITSNSVILNIHPYSPLHGIWTPATGWKPYTEGYWRVIIW